MTTPDHRRSRVWTGALLAFLVVAGAFASGTWVAGIAQDRDANARRIDDLEATVATLVDVDEVNRQEAAEQGVNLPTPSASEIVEGGTTSAGATGGVGPRGPAGRDGVSVMGPKGEEGEQGEQGEQGLPGEVGAPGLPGAPR